MPPQITKIPILPLDMINTYLIEGQDGCILVDAGLPASETKGISLLLRLRKVEVHTVLEPAFEAAHNG